MAIKVFPILYSIAHFSPSAVEHRHDLGTGAVVPEAYVDDIVVKTRKASDLLSDLEVTF